MNKIVFGHQNPDTDSICSALTYALGQKEVGEIVIPYRLGDLNKETTFILDKLNIQIPELLKEVSGQDVVLVDHNEFGQSVSNISEANVVEVYDHHRLANFETKNPINITIMPVGCTSTVLFTKFKNENINITKEMASLMLSAIISDTLLFKSPTCTPKDKQAARELAQISGLDIQSYGMEMLKAGTDLQEFPTEKLLDLDTKAFETSTGKYEVGQINTADIEEVKAQRNGELIQLITSRVEQKGLDAFMFIITDIVNSNSIAYVIGKNTDQIAKAFEKDINNNIIELPGVVSRKKQVVPFL